MPTSWTFIARNLLQDYYRESTASGMYYPGDDAKSETENYPDDHSIMTLVVFEAMRNLGLSRGRFEGSFYCLFKAGVTREFRDWLQPGNYLSE